MSTATETREQVVRLTQSVVRERLAAGCRSSARSPRSSGTWGSSAQVRKGNLS
ncbi:hypothetical protein SLNWT_6962 [Streptomyces albus]|uniref:Uncharacterized protein n=1 Tax=Streptomyces albus (strain ATCC 21838 / DSM 41398 / FERM P-419 / JCM 4703 / NBRC 107858) TaxID=1081613 RepID=A0A0B5EX20_STRA4|nr:hypothetical protein SLNWT_6962 [Streptomyces albus]AOU81640.1 hypothetical protein SLNHY_6949 [Streptomyces albus]